VRIGVHCRKPDVTDRRSDDTSFKNISGTKCLRISSPCSSNDKQNSPILHQEYYDSPPLQYTCRLNGPCPALWAHTHKQ
jgi:hypothetical protein